MEEVKEDIKEEVKEEVKEIKEEIIIEEEDSEEEDTNDNKEINKQTINNILKDLKNRSKYLLKKKELNDIELQEIQEYLIMLLYSDIIPIRKSMDYINIKLKNIDNDKDNYIKDNKLIFNKYKTFKTYGKQIILLPTILRTLIEKWKLINPTDYFLIDSNKNKLNSVKFTQRLNKLFGKNISVNKISKQFKKK